MADGISSRPTSPRPSVELTPSTPSVQVQPDAAAAIGQTNRDSLESAKDDRTTATRLQTARHDGGSALAGGQAEQSASAARSQSAAALQGEVASLGTHDASTLLFNEASLGDSAALLLEVASLRVPTTALEMAVASTLSAVSLAVADNVPHVFAEGPDGVGQALQLYAKDGDGKLAAVGLEVDAGRLGAAGYTGEGPVWPWLAALGLQDHLVEMMRQAPGAEPWALALAAMTGRDAVVLGRGAGSEALFRALSQSNPPLGLPVLVGLEDPLGGKALVVSGTGYGADGTAWVSLLDVEAWLAGAGEGARTTLALDEVLRRLLLAVLPDGRQGAVLTARHQATLSALGLTGCCLTTSAVHTGDGPRRRSTAVQHQGGLLDNRCLTCAAAQLACVPTPS